MVVLLLAAPDLDGPALRVPHTGCSLGESTLLAAMVLAIGHFIMAPLITLAVKLNFQLPCKSIWE
jgi:hypothetical protein